MAHSGEINQTIDYGYNDDFAMDRMDYAGGSEPFSYDNDGRVINVGQFTITNNLSNGLPEAIAGNSVSISQSHNA